MTEDHAEGPGYAIAEDGSFTAPLTLAYPYARTVGPTYGRFLRGLAEGRMVGTVATDGRVFVPPAEFDGRTGEALTTWSEVSTEGTVLSWTWEPLPQPGQPLDRAFAWVLVQLDGADTAMLHACDAGDPGAMSVGVRVQARFAEGAEPGIGALACFELLEGASHG
jgi:uncharacterized protein